MITRAIEKITNSMEATEEKRVPAEPIVKFLVKKCSEDEEFNSLVVPEQKTLEKCFNFVFEQVKNHLNRQSGWIDNGEVYRMAADYFYLDEAELERKKTEEEKKRQDERKQREVEFQQKTAEAKAKRDKEAQDIADKKAGSQQMSLFDLEGVGGT
jgi:hypothetical protein